MAGRGEVGIDVYALMERKPTDQEAAEAARWYARLRAQDCTFAERQAFAAWMGNPVHARAYAEARRVSRQVDDLAQDPRLRALAAAAFQDKAPGPRWSMPLRAAAAVLLGIATVTLVMLQQGRHPPTDAVHYANSGTKQQLIELDDGSRLHLDVGAQVDVRMTPAARNIELHSGRAYFEVAHDSSRPFDVVAAGVSTVALGTRFQVASDGRAVSVTLAEGSVAVSMSGAKGWREVLRPGEQLELEGTGGERIHRYVDTSMVIGWSSGRLVFKGTPLTEVLEEINRYASVKLRLGDVSLGKVAVGGTFVAGADSAQVANALAAVLPLNPVQVGKSEIVLFRRYEPAY